MFLRQGAQRGQGHGTRQDRQAGESHRHGGGPAPDRTRLVSFAQLALAFFTARELVSRAFFCTFDALTIILAARALATYIIVLAYILAAGPIGLVIAIVFRWKRGLYALGHAGVRLALACAGIRYRVAGRELVPATAVVFCANHESNVDPPVLFEALHPQLHVLYKAELHRFPIMGRVFDVGGFVPIDRHDRDKAMESIARGAEALREGRSFLIFPEGTRSRTGHLLPFKKGGFIMAIQAQAPIVPVAVQGGRAAMRKGSALVRPVRVSVRIGSPIPTAGLTLEDRDTLIQRVRTEIERLLKEGSLWE